MTDEEELELEARDQQKRDDRADVMEILFVLRRLNATDWIAVSEVQAHVPTLTQSRISRLAKAHTKLLLYSDKVTPALGAPAGRKDQVAMIRLHEHLGGQPIDTVPPRVRASLERHRALLLMRDLGGATKGVRG